MPHVKIDSGFCAALGAEIAVITRAPIRVLRSPETSRLPLVQATNGLKRYLVNSHITIRCSACGRPFVTQFTGLPQKGSANGTIS